MEMSNSTKPEDQKTLQSTTSVANISKFSQLALKRLSSSARRIRMAYDKVTLFDPFHFDNPKNPLQKKIDYGLSFTVEPREDIDPFQYVWSLSHEPAILCMFYCKEVKLSVVYKLIKHENTRETHTVECMPIKVIDGEVRPGQAGNLFTRDKNGIWRDVFTKAKLEGPIADSVKITETHYNSLDPLQWKPKRASTQLSNVED